jgi:hypothetical protein
MPLGSAVPMHQWTIVRCGHAGIPTVQFRHCKEGRPGPFLNWPPEAYSHRPPEGPGPGRHRNWNTTGSRARGSPKSAAAVQTGSSLHATVRPPTRARAPRPAGRRSRAGAGVFVASGVPPAPGRPDSSARMGDRLGDRSLRRRAPRALHLPLLHAGADETARGRAERARASTQACVPRTWPKRGRRPPGRPRQAGSASRCGGQGSPAFGVYHSAGGTLVPRRHRPGDPGEP